MNERKKHERILPSKADLIREVEHWRWQAAAAMGQTAPWLAIPGLIVHVNTDDLSDVEERITILNFALKQLRAQAARQANTHRQTTQPESHE